MEEAEREAELSSIPPWLVQVGPSREDDDYEVTIQ